MIDVHTFDGKLMNIFKGKYSTYEKDILFKKFLKELNDKDAIFIINKMINDMYIPRGENYQIENNLDSTDILAEILNKDYKEILPLIEEQLSDIKNLGQCPSGRVTRLLQILIIFI